MRVTLRNDVATKASSRIPGNYYAKSRSIILQVIGAGTCWFDTDRSRLENTDSTGTPTAGSSITSANGPMVFQQWIDEMWLRGSVIGVTVEVTELGVK